MTEGPQLREALRARGQGAERPGRMARPGVADGRVVVAGPRLGRPPRPGSKKHNYSPKLEGTQFKSTPVLGRCELPR